MNTNTIHNFVKFVMKELGISTLPKKIIITHNPTFPQTQLTFGTYAPDEDEIIVYGGTRHIADVLRTLAHELVHHKQRHDGKVLNGNDGSDIENEANAVAGTLLRKFKEVYPDLYVEN